MSDGELAEQPIGPVLDDLGVMAALRPGQRVTEVLVIAKVMDLDDGVVALGMFDSGVDWVSQIGLIEAARNALHSASFTDTDD